MGKAFQVEAWAPVWNVLCQPRWGGWTGTKVPGVSATACPVCTCLSSAGLTARGSLGSFWFLPGSQLSLCASPRQVGLLSWAPLAGHWGLGMGWWGPWHPHTCPSGCLLTHRRVCKPTLACLGLLAVLSGSAAQPGSTQQTFGCPIGQPEPRAFPRCVPVTEAPSWGFRGAMLPHPPVPLEGCPVWLGVLGLQGPCQEAAAAWVSPP